MTPRPEAFAVLCAALSIVAWRRWPEHGPIAVVLCLSAARDVLGAVVVLPVRLDVAWLLVVLCASGWAYERTWAPRSFGAPWTWPTIAAFACGLTAWAPDALLGPWQTNSPLVVAAVVVSTGGVHMAMSRRAGWSETCSSQVALVLLAGDIGGVLSGFNPATIAGHASLQLLAASLVHVAWLASPRSA